MNLNWATMKKEHKQAVLLVGMWVAGPAGPGGGLLHHSES